MKNPAVHFPYTIREGSPVEEFDCQKRVLDKLILISLIYIYKSSGPNEEPGGTPCFYHLRG